MQVAIFCDDSDDEGPSILAKMRIAFEQVDIRSVLFHLPCDFGLGKKKDEICGFGIFLFMTRFNCFY